MMTDCRFCRAGKPASPASRGSAFIPTHRSQSTAMMRVTSSAGRPTALSTITMVTRPACGTPAAPMLAAVAVTLQPNTRAEKELDNCVSLQGPWPGTFSPDGCYRRVPPTLAGQDLFSAEHQLCLVRERWGTERSPSPSAGRHGKSL